MQKLRTIIVDDEPLALKLLRTVLSEISDVEIVAECSNGKQAVEAATELEPELIFLDIQMPGMNGFDVIKSLQTDIMPMVVLSLLMISMRLMLSICMQWIMFSSLWIVSVLHALLIVP